MVVTDRLQDVEWGCFNAGCHSCGVFGGGLLNLDVRGGRRHQVLHLFRFIDWIMDLPAHLEQSFWLELRAFEQEKQMPFVTIAERFGREEGLREGLLAGIEIGLNLRFGASGQELLPEIQRVADVDQLTTILHSIQTVSSPAELRRLWS